MQELPLKQLDLVLFALISVVIYVFHIPGLGFLRIDAVALTVILFCLYRVDGISLATVFLLGLVQDIVSLAPLGQHALGLCVVAYFMRHFRDRILIQSVGKQIPGIALSLLALKLIYGWVAALGFGQLPSIAALLSVVFTAMLWPITVWFGKMLTQHRKLPGIGH